MNFQSSAYLTIDDSASQRMDDLTSYLFEKGIPAVFYCRGDRLEENPDAAISAIQKGFVLGNHTYTHPRSSQIGIESFVDEIERCEDLIADLYKRAGVAKQHKLFRFPHVDRGTAGWIVDYDAYEGLDRAGVLAAFAQGLNVQSLDKPDEAMLAKRDLLQAYLKEAGYTQPFQNVTHHWFNQGEVAKTYDCLYTYSNCDWMLTARHQGKWPYKTVGDLKVRAREDQWLSEEGSVNVILAHDQAEIVDITIELIEDLANSGMTFLEV
jgi:peptidoglycan/xylan/chitin deacetylase (PgdA/CDA1 family)